jgi:hypothetical protein
MSLIKSAKVSKEPAYENGKPYISKEIKDPKTAFSACLHLVFQHTAEVYEVMLKVIAEKYGHSVEEMTEAVTQDERFKNMMVNPALRALDYFGEEDLAKVIPAEATEAEETEITEKMSNLSVKEETRPVKVKRVVKKITKKSVKEESDV